MINPYVSRKPVYKPGSFVGRQDELVAIYTHLEEDTLPIAIVGERKIGVTSFLLRIMYSDNLENVIKCSVTPVYLDCRECKSDILPWFAHAVIQRVSRSLNRESDTFLNKVASCDDNSQLTKSLAGALSDLLNNTQLLVIMDEFEALPSAQMSSFMAFMVMVFPAYLEISNEKTGATALIRFLIGSRLTPREIEGGNDPGSPWFIHFHKVHLTSFTRKEAVQLIKDPSAQSGIPLSHYAVFLMDLASTHPYLLSIACHHALAQKRHAKGRLGKSEQHLVQQAFRNDVEEFFEFYWDLLTPRQRGFLQRFAKKPPDFEQRLLWDTDIRRLLSGGFIFTGEERMDLCPSMFHEFVLSRHDSTTMPYIKTDTIARHLDAFAACERFILERQKIECLANEKHVQDLLYTMLRPYYSDIIIEEPTHKTDGRSRRIDIAIRSISCGIEVKYIRSKSHGKRVTIEINDDIEAYRSSTFRTIIFFLYDPGRYISDPDQLADWYARRHQNVMIVVVPR